MPILPRIIIFYNLLASLHRGVGHGCQGACDGKNMCVCAVPVEVEPATCSAWSPLANVEGLHLAVATRRPSGNVTHINARTWVCPYYFSIVFPLLLNYSVRHPSCFGTSLYIEGRRHPIHRLWSTDTKNSKSHAFCSWLECYSSG